MELKQNITMTPLLMTANRFINQKVEYCTRDSGEHAVLTRFMDADNWTLSASGAVVYRDAGVNTLAGPKEKLKATLEHTGHYINHGGKHFDLNRDEYDILELWAENIAELTVENLNRHPHKKPTWLKIKSHEPCDLKILLKNVNVDALTIQKTVGINYLAFQDCTINNVYLGMLPKMIDEKKLVGMGVTFAGLSGKESWRQSHIYFKKTENTPKALLEYKKMAMINCKNTIPMYCEEFIKKSQQNVPSDFQFPAPKYFE